MRAWQMFWSVSLLLAGGAFTVITLIVAMKGFEDLQDLFRRLHPQQDEDE